MKLSWLWPIIIMFSTISVGFVYFINTGILVRPAVVMWFLFVCPGMVVIRFLRLREPVIEWTLSLALSLCMDAIIGGIQLYTGHWSPTGTLIILMSLCLVGSIMQIVMLRSSISVNYRIGNLK